MNIKLIAYGIGIVSLITIGWQTHDWYITAKYADMYQTALAETQLMYQSALDVQAERYDAQVLKSLDLEKQNAALKEQHADLQEEINHVQFTPSTDGVCRSHPVSSPDFVRLYAKAATGGEAPGRGADSP